MLNLGRSGKTGRVIECRRSVLAAVVLAALSATIGLVQPASEGVGTSGEVSSGGRMMAADPSGGYWTVSGVGVVTPFQGAPSFGSPASSNLQLASPIVGMDATPDGHGYWLVASDGGIFTYGDAQFYGSAGAIHLNMPIVGMAATPDGRGYWLVASDGGIFTYGDARFYGSTGAIHLNMPIVGMASTPDAKGYWLVASDGGIFSFGDASFYGSTGAIHLNMPIVGMASTPDAKGYWLVASDGGIFNFGDAAFYGSLGGTGKSVLGIIVSPKDPGYTLVASDGSSSAFRPAFSPTQQASPPGSSSTTSTTISEPGISTTTSTTFDFPGINPTVPAVQVSGNQLINRDGRSVRLLGVDATGTEDACIEGGGFGWGALNDAEADSIASWDANAVRVPLNEDCWLGINGAPSQHSAAAYRSAIENWVNSLNQAGMIAILDLHWAAPGSYQANQLWPMADADHSITFWSQVASTFSSNPMVVFDLYSEPFIGQYHPTTADWSCWLRGCTTTFAATYRGTTTNVTYSTAGMQQLVNAVRNAGATQPIMVGGLNWAGDPCGSDDSGNNGGACTWLTYKPTDPLHQLIASFHTYNWTACNTSICWNNDVLPLAAHVPIVTAELGEDDCSVTYINQYMGWADQHGLSYLAWSWQTQDANITQCTPSDGNTGSVNNFQFLSSWSGAPNTIAPEGGAVFAHLETEDASSAYPF